MQHYGIATIRIEGDREEGQRLVPRAQRCLRRLQERLQAGGIETGGKVWRLTDTAYCFTRVAMDVNVIHIVAGYGIDHEFTQFEVSRKPDFYSGIVTGGTITEDESRKNKVLNKFEPTARCARMFDLPRGDNKPQRLAVKPHVSFQDTKESAVVRSQYSKVKPTMYSGTMRKLVQFIMGYGFIPEKSIYDTTRRPLNEKAPAQTRYEQEIARDGLQVRYDYRFARTHGLVRADDGRWWLVEISVTRGIVAMPLPMFVETQTPEFREQLEAMGDNNGLAILDLFGGFPNGDGFSVLAEENEALFRAGYLLKLGSASEFYSNNPYSSVTGWAFSDSGREAHNTAYYFGQDGVQRGVHYAVAFSFPAMPVIEPAPNAERLIRALSSVGASEPKRWGAAKLKINRMDESQIELLLRDIANAGGASAVWKEVDELVLDPVIAAKASLYKVSEGYLWNPGSRSPYQVKFYEPNLPGLLSHDFRPQRSAQGAPDEFYPCDTTMYVFFSGEELKYVRFFNGPTRPVSETESDFEPCMFIGQWTSTTISGTYGIGRAVYSNDIDGREESAENISITTFKSVSQGYTPMIVGDDPVDPRFGTTTRSKRFLQTTKTETRNGTFKRFAAIIPANERQCCYIAEMDYTSSSSIIESTNYAFVEDPNIGIHYQRLYGGNLHPECSPQTMPERRIFRLEYNPGECSDVADSGTWLSICQFVEPVGQPDVPPSTSSTVSKGSSFTVTVWLMSGGEYGTFQVSSVNNQGEAWFVPSPDPDSQIIQNMAVGQNVIGATVLLYNLFPNGPGHAAKGPAEFSADRDPETTCFIGVVE